MAGKAERRGGSSSIKHRGTGHQGGHRAAGVPARQRAPGKGNAAARRYAGVPPRPRPSSQPATPPAPYDGPPPDAMVMAVARRDGREVDRWCGPMDWYWALPMHFEGTRRGRTWTWSDEQAAELRLESPHRRGGGVLASAWADRRGADHLDLLLAPHPDVHASARRTAPGRSDAEIAFDAMFADMLGVHAEPGGVAAGGDAAAGADPPGGPPGDDAGTGGRGHQGTGPGAGRDDRADRALSGSGVADGRDRGHARGSHSPSWIQVRGAERDDHGGRTPDEHGERGGSAGGTRGGAGHLLGLGLWDGLIDVSAEVAAAVNVAILITDANVAGVGEKLLGRVARGLGARALRDQLEREARRVVAARMRRLRRDLVDVSAFTELSRAEQAEGLARIEETIERAFYDKARVYFGKRAEDSEAVARQYARAGDAPGDETARQLREVAAQNADAYRKMERAAVENGGLDADALARPDGSGGPGGPGRVHALGDGPEADALHTTSARGAGAVRHAGQTLTHQHHVLPQEHRAWFEQRGFVGEHDIDNYCIELPEVDHQALHGGGNWKLARKEWPEGEWNTALMKELEERERDVGRKLTREEILAITREQMAERRLGNHPFVTYKARK